MTEAHGRFCWRSVGTDLGPALRTHLGAGLVAGSHDKASLVAVGGRVPQQEDACGACPTGAGLEGRLWRLIQTLKHHRGWAAIG